MGLGQKNYIKLSLADISRGSWASAIEVHYKVRCRNFGDRLPRVVFTVIFLLLDEALEPSLVLAAVKDLFHFPLLFFIDEYQWGASFQFAAWYQVFWGDEQFDYIKDGMQLSYQVWQLQLVSHGYDLSFYSEQTQPLVRKLLEKAGSPDIWYI